MTKDEEWQKKVDVALRWLHGNIDKNPEGIYNFLMTVDDLDDFIDGNALNFLGILRDVSEASRKVTGLEKVIDLSQDIQTRDLSPENTARLHYTIGNAHSSLKLLTGSSHWTWEDPHTEEEIRNFRKALDAEGVLGLKQIEIQRAYTNLGNSLSTVGRPIEAFDYWREALERAPDFGPPKGQIGIALSSYAQHHYDRGHQAHLLRRAFENLGEALDSDDLHPDMRKQFTIYYEAIGEILPEAFLDKELKYNTDSLGKGDEKRYREWCLEKRLFLNSLNDITIQSIAAKDIVHLPSVTASDPEKLVSCVGFYNQLKQEFVSARYLLFDGINSTGPHFSDRRVRLENTLDYPAYSLGVEKVKVAYRTAYSLFDKISTFINYYFNLSYLKDHQLHFDKIWYTATDKSNLAPEFVGRENWALRGLFWLSKDLEFGSELTVEDSLDPGAEELRRLRNDMEHAYVKTHISFSENVDFDDRFGKDELARSVYRDELEDYALSIVKKARAALIYLALAIQTEESEKSEVGDDKVVPIELGVYDDDWKL